MKFEEAELLVPVLFAFAVAAIVIFGPRRGRMEPGEKAAAVRFFGTLVPVVVAGVSCSYMDRWLAAQFGFSHWISLAVTLGFAGVIGLLARAVRELIDKRAEVRHGS